MISVESEVCMSVTGIFNRVFFFLCNRKFKCSSTCGNEFMALCNFYFIFRTRFIGSLGEESGQDILVVQIFSSTYLRFRNSWTAPVWVRSVSLLENEETMTLNCACNLFIENAKCRHSLQSRRRLNFRTCTANSFFNHSDLVDFYHF